MNVQEYIKEVIFQIADGVKDVIAEQEMHDVIINPTMTIGPSEKVRFIPNEGRYDTFGRPAQLLNFEIGIQTTESNQIEINGGINLSVIKGNGNGTEYFNQSSINRICLAIPVCLPNSKIEQKK